MVDMEGGISSAMAAVAGYVLVSSVVAVYVDLAPHSIEANHLRYRSTASTTYLEG